MITTEQFNAAVMEASVITKWRDLMMGEIYEIVGHDIFETQVGESMKLSLRDADGDLYTVWAPERVKETLRGKQYTHIRCNGLRPTKDGNSHYWSFNVVTVHPPSGMHS